MKKATAWLPSPRPYTVSRLAAFTYLDLRLVVAVFVSFFAGAAFFLVAFVPVFLVAIFVVLLSVLMYR